MNTAKIISDLKQLEGFVPHAYQDTRSFLTIGYGTLIDERGGGITEEEATYLLTNRMNSKIEELDTNISWWRLLDDVRQDVIVEMAYQLGVGGLLEFKNFLSYAHSGQYDRAASEMLNSDWAKQTPDRVQLLSQRFGTGRE